MDGETGKEGEIGIEGEAGRRCFPLAEMLAFSLLGSILPSHIVRTARNATNRAVTYSASNMKE